MSVNFLTATQTKAQKDSLKYNRLYQLKVDVGMLNTVKNYWDDILSVNPLSFALMKG